MSKDARALREEAAVATASGKHKRALAAYLELERAEPRDAQWAKRAAEAYRKLGRDSDAISAYGRSAERYAQNGFLVQAIAVCKLILQISPNQPEWLRRLSEMNERLGAGPTRASEMAEHNVGLHALSSVNAIRRPTTVGPLFESAQPDPVSAAVTQPPAAQVQAPITVVPSVPRAPQIPLEAPAPRRRTESTPPLAVPRTRSRPVSLSPGEAINSMSLADAVPDSVSSLAGIYIIPIDDDDMPLDQGAQSARDKDRSDSELDIEIVASRDSSPTIELQSDQDVLDLLPDQVEEPTELELDDIEEVPLAEPRAAGAQARRALSETPLFAGLPSEALEALVGRLELVSLERGDVLFREGDPGDALYVVVEGEVIMQAEGPPRVEMARFGAGAFLGEVALMTDQPRPATVTALNHAELLKIDRGTLAAVLAEHGDVLRAVLRFVRDRLVERWMRTSPLFRPFDEASRRALVARFKFLEIGHGTTILAANQRPDGLYIVLAGQFIVTRQGQGVAQLGPGDLIGETALLSGQTFRSDVVARGKGLALCLPANDFREVIMTHPHVLEYIGQQAEAAKRLQIW